MTMRMGLALGGGAARGWAHLGVLEVLGEHGIQVGAIAGTSIGALVGAFAAAGKLEQLRTISSTFGKRQAVKLFDPVFPVYGVFDGLKVERFLREQLGTLNIEDLPIPYAAVAVNLASGEPVEFCQGSLVEAVRASISIPGLFTPAMSEQGCCVDGGLANPLPVDVVRRLCDDPVIAVDLNKDLPPQKGERRPNMMKVLNSTVIIMERQLTRLRLQASPPDLIIRPALGDVGLLDFHAPARAVAAGRLAAETALADYLL